MGLGFLPWEKLPPKYRGLPFVILGMLAMYGVFAEKRFNWVYLLFSLFLIALGPIVFLWVRSEAIAAAYENREKE